MTALWLLLVSIAIMGTIAYNIAVKMGGDLINPFVFTVILTAVAFVGHGLAFAGNKLFFNPELKFTFGLSGFLFAALAGIGVVFIDLAYFYAVKSGGLAITNAFWVVGGLVATVIISLFFFSEAIGPIKTVGLVLGVLSLILIAKP